MAINRGNSGGPLIRTDGQRWSASNSWILSSHGGNIGLSFAIPIEVAQSSVEAKLLEYGRVVRGFSWRDHGKCYAQTADALNLIGRPGGRPPGAWGSSRSRPDSPADLVGINRRCTLFALISSCGSPYRVLPPLSDGPSGTEVDVEIVSLGGQRPWRSCLMSATEEVRVMPAVPPQTHRRAMPWDFRCSDLVW